MQNLLKWGEENKTGPFLTTKQQYSREERKEIFLGEGNQSFATLGTSSSEGLQFPESPPKLPEKLS